MATVAAAQAVRTSADGGGVMAVDLSMPILVVDDYNTMIRIIRNLLRQLGFEDVDDAIGRLRRALQDAAQEIRPGDLGLEHGADDRLRAAQAGALRSRR